MNNKYRGRPKGSKNKISRMLSIICRTCTKIFKIYPSRINKTKYCSLSCAAKQRNDIYFKKGNKINLGKKYSDDRKRKISIGNKKAWENPVLRENFGKQRLREKNPAWINDPKNYSTIHKWLIREFGKANKCIAINCDGKKKKYEWALIKGNNYSRKKDNFAQLCTRCHRYYDKSKKTIIILPTSQK